MYDSGKLADAAGVLAVRGYSKRYASGLSTKLAFQNLNADLPTQAITVLYGPNGSGKTSFLRCLAGIARATSGTVALRFGRSTSVPRFQYVAEGGRGFHASLSVAENLRWAELIGGRASSGSPFLEAMPGLGELVGTAGPAKTLSRGQKQLLSVAMGLAKRADFYLFDEPTNGLDPRAEADIVAAIRMARSLGAGVVVATHNLALQSIADRLIFMHEGKIVAERPATSSACLKCELKLKDAATALRYYALGFDREEDESTAVKVGSVGDIIRAIQPVDPDDILTIRIVDTAISTLYFDK